MQKREKIGLQPIKGLSKVHFVNLSGEAFVFLNPPLEIK